VISKERKAPSSSDDILSLDEFEKLSGLYGEVQRAHGGVLGRATRLERVIRDLEILDGSGSIEEATDSRDFRPTWLEVFRIDEQIDELDNETLTDVFFQLLLRQLRVAQSSLGALVVLGADRIRTSELERFSDYCEREGTRAVLFFEHLRDYAVQMIGVGGKAAVGFLASTTAPSFIVYTVADNLCRFKGQHRVHRPDARCQQGRDR